MRSPLTRFLIVIVALLIATAPVLAAPPSSINYQGILTDPSGMPQVGTFSVTFNLYGLSFGGGSLWSETQMVTTDSLGRFSIALGTVNPLNESYFTFGNRFLGITIPPDAEMSPRQQIHSVPFALRTQTVDGSTGGQMLGNLQLSGELEALGMSSKIRFDYDFFGDLPDPTTYDGAVAHVNDTGRLYFAHAGQWVPLANESDVTALSSLAAPDGDPDPAVDVDSSGNVAFSGNLRGVDSPLLVGDSGMIVNGGVIFNDPVYGNGVIIINNGAQLLGGNLNIVGPQWLRIQNGAACRVLNGGELELESGSHFFARTTSELRIDAGVDWTSSAALHTEAELDVVDPGYLHVHNASNSVMSDLLYDRLTMDDGLRTMELRPTDLTQNGTQFDINANKLVVNTPVPVEMLSLNLTGGPGLSASGGGGVSVTGGGSLTTDPISPLVVNGPATFNQPITSPVQIGAGPAGAGQLHVVGNITATGAKLFVQDHPTDPTKEIRYIALEAGEAGTYTRGTGQLINGVAVVDLPEDFGLVTGGKGLTAQVTPRAAVQSMLFVESVSTSQLVVKSSNPQDGSVPFDFMVNGIRIGFEGHQPIQDKPVANR